MIVSRLPKFALVLLFAFYLCVGFMVGFKLAGSLIEQNNTVVIKDITTAGISVLVFLPGDVKIVRFEELESFTSQYQNYSFIVPEGLENFYRQKLRSYNNHVIYEMEVEQLAENRQLISFVGDDIRSLEKLTCEATEKEIFPKTMMWLNWRDTPLKLFVSTFCGALTFLIFYLIYRKYLVNWSFSKKSACPR